MQSSFAEIRSTGLKLLPCLLMPERQLLLIDGDLGPYQLFTPVPKAGTEALAGPLGTGSSRLLPHLRANVQAHTSASTPSAGLFPRVLKNPLCGWYGVASRTGFAPGRAVTVWQLAGIQLPHSISQYRTDLEGTHPILQPRPARAQGCRELKAPSSAVTKPDGQSSRSLVTYFKLNNKLIGIFNYFLKL